MTGLRAVGIVASFTLLACRAVQPSTGDTLTVGNCTGPAASLAADLAGTLPPRTGMMKPDDDWADLAAEVPGGFAGVWYRNPGLIPMLMLTRPDEADAAKAALAGKVPGFPIADAEVRQARWDFLQLVNWYNYFWTQPAVHQSGINSGDKDESINRIVFGTETVEQQVALAGVLVNLGVPCDLVRIVIREPARALGR